MKFGKKWTKIEPWGLLQLVVCKNLNRLLINNKTKEKIIIIDHLHNNNKIIIKIIKAKIGKYNQNKITKKNKKR